MEINAFKYSQYATKRRELQRELNKELVPRFTPEVFKKDKTDKKLIKSYKDLKKKSPGLVKQYRDEVLEVLVNSKVPEWGGITVTVL